jgi:phenylacetate-CoA ligase
MPSLVLSPAHLDRFLTDLDRFRPHFVYGYGQGLFRLAEHAAENQRDLKSLDVKAVISTAEMISPAQRDVIASAFAAPVVNEYGCTEVGIIAMECPERSMHISEDGLIVEIVRDGVPVAPDEEGEIVVTELFGSVMPLIRYRTGDRGILSSRRCRCGRGLSILEQLSGRVTDLIRCPNGALVDPYLLESLLKSQPEMYASIRQLRVEQVVGVSVLVTLATVAARRHPEIESYLRRAFDSRTGGQLSLRFQYQEWLEPRASGKTR